VKRRRNLKPKAGDLLAAATAVIQAQEQARQEGRDDERLDESTVKKFMQLSRAELDVLNQIARGHPPRNALAILAAIRLKLEHTVAPVVSAGAGAVPITVTVNTLGPEPRATVQAEPPPPPEPQDLVEDDELEIH
jgi:hypothetical protein